MGGPESLYLSLNIRRKEWKEAKKEKILSSAVLWIALKNNLQSIS
jgi:hypothetical protein